jgi:nucleoid DNA-binding protein
VNKSELVNIVASRLSVDDNTADIAVNEILAVHILPDPFRRALVQKLIARSSLTEKKAEMAINEFIGRVTADAALFEEVTNGFLNAASCRSCNCCNEVSGKA